ncbi:MAG: amidohydrolase family protein, partial [bacterium]
MRTRSFPLSTPSSVLAGALILALALPAGAQSQDPPAPEHGKRYRRLLIQDVYLIDGNGTPATGPTRVLVEEDRIVQIGGRVEGDVDAVIEGQGRYLLPGLINSHAHLQDSRGGVSMPFQYQLDLWLASGITTIRDVGSDREKALRLREQSRRGEIAAPRIHLYMTVSGRTPDEIRESVREIEAAGGDGIKLFGLDRDLLAAALDEARRQDLRSAHHVGVEETDAWDDIAGGTTTIEHWYGIPDAALPYGSQSFPPGYNYSNELDRFRWAGRLFKEADPEKLGQVLQAMVDAEVAWIPTLTIYEASRDVMAARNQPWFEECLHPALEAYFQPDLASHGSYFLGWTTEDEVEWKHNYQLWFAALREFARRGGLIGVGEDAGFIYRLYGFGYVRELELQQEAGFHPLDVIKHATGNNARIMGLEDRIGRIKFGYKADLILV